MDGHKILTAAGIGALGGFAKDFNDFRKWRRDNPEAPISTYRWESAIEAVVTGAIAGMLALAGIAITS